MGRDEDFERVRSALRLAGLPADDFGVFASGRHPEVIHQPVFDYARSVPVLLELLPTLTDDRAKEAVVRSLSTSAARTVAVPALVELFEHTSDVSSPSLKWAIGNALSTTTTKAHTDVLLRLASDHTHGSGRSMIVERLGRISGDERIVPALLSLIDDPGTALTAMGGLRRRLPPDECIALFEPLLDHDEPKVRTAAKANLSKARKKQSGRSGS